MALNVISLSKLLASGQPEEDIERLLFSFESLSDNGAAEDIELFLHKKAIQFEKVDLARTYLVMSTFKDVPYLAGYFSIANKPLIIQKKVYSKLSTSLQKKLMGFGHKTDQRNYECKGYLIGQLGKNYSVQAQVARQLSGKDLLELAYRKILEAHEIVGGRIVHLECQDIPALKKFYEGNGFREIKDFESPNGMCIFVKNISAIQ
ncbi:GNAT family acetyltransferase [Enterococcus asini]|uniref:GNAT family acetyltransferase n=1 Tax=Enterococcus asini TaxID=57732 RepID=UPI000E4D392C|nr:GNAT family acetyltransferase [Enterococcus asini]RGW15228.1 GNAT family acetyltransferase [Enterococcus asini]